MSVSRAEYQGRDFGTSRSCEAAGVYLEKGRRVARPDIRQ